MRRDSSGKFLTGAPVPCVWARITCHGQVDADGLGWAGCGLYDVSALDIISLKENNRTCKFCGTSNIEINDQFCKGATTQPIGQPTKPILMGDIGQDRSTLGNHSPGRKRKRAAHASRMGNALDFQEETDREPNGRKRRTYTGTRHYVSTEAPRGKRNSMPAGS